MADESAANNPDSSATVTTPAPAPIETESSAPSTQTIQPVAAPQAPAPVQADMPAQPGFAKRVYQGIMGALGGTQDTTYAIDPQTRKLVATSTPSGPGTQWKRMIAGAVQGTAAGLSVAPGPGQLARAAGAGIGAGMQGAQQQDTNAKTQAAADYDRDQKTLVQKAQTQALVGETSRAAFELSRAQTVAKMDDANRESAFVRLIQSGGNGSQDLGVAKNFGEAIQMHKDMPGLMTQYVHGNVAGVAHVNADGQFDGMHYALVTPEWSSAKLDGDQSFYQLQPPTKAGEAPTIQKQTVKAGTMTNGAFLNAQTAASNEILKWHEDDRKQGDEEKLQKSEITRNNASAAKDTADAKKAAAEAAAVPSPENMSDSEIVKGMLDGTVDITKTASIRGNKREAYVEAAKKADPNFNMGDYATRLKLRQSFVDGKDADQITSFNAFLGHAMDASQGINALRNTKVPWINTPMNKLRSQAAGNPNINAFIIQQDAAKDEFQNFLSNNRALHETDKEEGKKMINENMSPAQQQGAMKQFVTTAAIRMSALNHKWSSTFHQDYPNMLDEDGTAALAHFGVPESMVYHHPTGTPPTGMIAVQTADGTVGHIPASAKTQFLTDNKGSKVVQ